MQQTSSAIQNLSTRSLIIFATLLACLWVGTLGMRKLLNPDEARYAEIPREMIASGDWLTPRLNDLKYFEKPPLQYWGTAVAFEILGTNEFAARLWCGLTGLAGVWFAAWAGSRLFGRDAGVMAAAVLASSLMYFAIAHLNTLDMGLSFFLEVAVFGFLLAQHAPFRSTRERNFMLLAWAAAALAVLSKGIVAMALPSLALVVYTAVERDFTAWRRLHVLAGAALFLAICAPWFIWVSLRNPEFPEFFFLHEHFQRFLTDVADRVEPWWYFIPLLLLGAMPWTALAVAALASAWRRDAATDKKEFRTRRFLILWVGATVFFFSVSHSKLPPYIVPVFPAIALLIGERVTVLTGRQLRTHLLAIFVFWAAALAYVLFGPLPTRRDVDSQVFAEVFHWATGGFSLAFVGAGAGVYLAGRGRVREAVLCACGGVVLALSALVPDFAVMRQLRSGYDLSAALAPIHDPAKPFYSVQAYDHSLSFYLARVVTTVDYKGELVFGQQQEPDKSLTDMESFKRAWERDPAGTLAVMTPPVFDHLHSQNLAMAVVGRDLHLIAVKKP